MTSTAQDSETSTIDATSGDAQKAGGRPVASSAGPATKPSRLPGTQDDESAMEEAMQSGRLRREGDDVEGVSSMDDIEQTGRRPRGDEDIEGVSSMDALEQSGRRMRGDAEVDGVSSMDALEQSGRRLRGEEDLEGISSMEEIEQSVRRRGEAAADGISSMEEIEPSGIRRADEEEAATSSMEEIDASGLRRRGEEDADGISSMDQIKPASRRIGSALDAAPSASDPFGSMLDRPRQPPLDEHPSSAEVYGHPSMDAGHQFTASTVSSQPSDRGSSVPDPGGSTSRIARVGGAAEAKRPVGGPSIRGPRMARSGTRGGDLETGRKAPGDPTVQGAFRMAAAQDRQASAHRGGPTMEGAVVLPPVPADWARMVKKPAPAADAFVPGLVVERIRTVEVQGEPAPEQRAFARDTSLRDATERRMDFQHQRFEFVRVRRPVLRPSGGGEAECCRWPVYLGGAAPIGNGLLAQVIAARFSDHDSTRAWARIVGRLGIRVTGEGLSEAVVGASIHLAPVWQALRDQVLSQVSCMDEEDLPVRVANGRHLREGRVRAVASGGLVWFAWRDGDDLAPVLPRGVSAPASGHLAFDLFADGTGRSRSGRWARVRQALHGLLPQDPERAAYALHLAHRVRRAMTADPNPEVLGAASRAFRQWLEARHREFDAPRSPLERVVVRLVSEWAALSPVDEAGHPTPPLHALRTGRQSPTMTIDTSVGPPADLFAWHSLVESCHRLGLRPWDYLHELIQAAAHGRLGSPGDWTPTKWAARH
ncbi:MAG: transposase [Myxococcota bacterium]|nr:transposase [Myxococcota bacterium]